MVRRKDNFKIGKQRITPEVLRYPVTLPEDQHCQGPCGDLFSFIDLKDGWCGGCSHLRYLTKKVKATNA